MQKCGWVLGVGQLHLSVEYNESQKSTNWHSLIIHTFSQKINETDAILS